jgi:hypothetical protein
MMFLSTFAAAQQNHSMEYRLSNFAFVTAAFAIFAVTLARSLLCYVSISDLLLLR